MLTITKIELLDLLIRGLMEVGRPVTKSIVISYYSDDRIGNVTSKPYRR